MRGHRDRLSGRTFVYVSEAMLKDFVDQADDTARPSILKRLRLSIALKVPLLSVSVEPTADSRLVGDRSRNVRVAMAEKIIRAQHDIGDLAEGTYWIAGRVDMELDPLTDGEMALFCGYAGPLLVALYGSAANLTEVELPGPRLGSNSYAVRTEILDVDDPKQRGDRLAAAAQKKRFPPKPVRFLAQVRQRGPITGGGHQREFVLATPLYVAHAHFRDESPDTALRGRVHWSSADGGWGLITPAGEEQDAVVYEAGTAPALAASELVEFRVTHGTAGIVATSVSALDTRGPGTARSRKRAARWLRAAIAGALVAAAVAVAAFVVVDLSPGGGPQACPASKLAGLHQVTGPSGGPATDGSLNICPVQLQVDNVDAAGPRITLSGAILGQIPAGKVLIVVSRPDPGSCDESGNPGTGGYYLVGPVNPDGHGAWTATSGPSYPGGQPIQRHLYFLLGSPAAVNAFKNAQAASSAGAQGAPWTLANENLQLIGSFTFTPVQPPDRYCPAK